MKKHLQYSLFFASLVLSLCMMSYNASAQEARNNDRSVFVSQDNSLTVYPMPATTTAYIRIAAGLRNDVDQIEIVNVVGRKVTAQKIVDKGTTEVVFNNLGNLPKGIYVVVARDQYGKILQSAKLLLNN